MSKSRPTALAFPSPGSLAPHAPRAAASVSPQKHAGPHFVPVRVLLVPRESWLRTYFRNAGGPSFSRRLALGTEE